MFPGSLSPRTGHPDAHKDASADISEKGGNPEFLLSYLRFKCVQELRILNLIK